MRRAKALQMLDAEPLPYTMTLYYIHGTYYMCAMRCFPRKVRTLIISGKSRLKRDVRDRFVMPREIDDTADQE